ncbi:MAG: molybdopterin-dependent oxidoreductase [Shewanella sp.]|nr:molybdopterin-dependent oxidoreductase [Shewanella sp.]
MERRSFLKMSAALGCAATVSACSPSAKPKVFTKPVQPTGKEVQNWSACLVNCGSNCPIKVFSRDGVITRIETDHETSDQYGENHQIRCCTRGRSLRQRTYAPDRLRTPMKRIGATRSGEVDQFVAISWEQAYKEVGEKLAKIRAEHGPASTYFHYRSGAYYGFAGYQVWQRLLNKTGGYLDHHWDYSWAQLYMAAEATYGDAGHAYYGSRLAEITNADLFVGIAFNPNEIRMSGSGEGYDFVQALNNHPGDIKVYMVDTRYTDSMLGKEHKWLPIRPGTDAALAEAIAHEMITSGWIDKNSKAFLDKYCLGYDFESLTTFKAEWAVSEDAEKQRYAALIDPKENYKDYILGTYTGLERTPEWAAARCGVPATQIRELAHAIMNAKAPYISIGAGFSRHANGDQAARALYMLPILTGKLGQPGVNTGAMPMNYGLGVAGIDIGNNAVKATIPVFTFAEAIERGTEFTPYTHNLKGADKLDSNIKAIINVSGNAIVNQHSDINGTTAILSDTSKCELIVVCDCWMTPSARYADYILPAATWLESDDLAGDSYASGQMGYMTMMSTGVKPLGEAKNMYDICADLAKAMGCDDYTEGKTVADWNNELYAKTLANNPDIGLPATYAEATKQGVFRKYMPQSFVVLQDWVAGKDDAYGVKTPSGKIEIFSLTLADKRANWQLQDYWSVEDRQRFSPEQLADRYKITALPQYVVTWEGYEDKQTAAEYPLQLIGYHTKGRVHSSYDNVPWLREAVEDAVWMNPIDAQARNLTSGETVRVWNDRGMTELPVRITPRIAPGVVAMGQGRWYKPGTDKDHKGRPVDINGALNVLTKYHPTPIVKGNPQHTNRVQIAAKKEA